MIWREYGEAAVYTFPFWIFVSRSSPPQIEEIQLGEWGIRIYPPFRCAPWYSINQPRLEEKAKVPFPPGKRPSNLHFRFVPPPIMIPYQDDQGAHQLGMYVTDPDGNSPSPPDERLPMDSIRLDLYSSNLTKAPERAEGFITELMQVIRWRTGQWWVTRSNYGLSRFGGVPFPVRSDGAFLRKHTMNSGLTRARTLGEDEKFLDDTIWKQCIRDVESGAQVPIYDVFLLDAEFFARSGDIRQAVVEADSACEHLKELTFGRLWSAKNPGGVYDAEKRDKLLRNWDLPRHIHEKFDNHFKRSYKTEHPKEWEWVNNLWTARNNIAHGGPAVYGDPPIRVDAKVFDKMLEAAKHCVRWLESL